LEVTAPAIEAWSADEFRQAASFICAKFAEQLVLTINARIIGSNRNGHHLQITLPCLYRIKLKIVVVFCVISKNSATY
jgi:hypothetical protein